MKEHLPYIWLPQFVTTGIWNQNFKIYRNFVLMSDVNYREREGWKGTENAIRTNKFWIFRNQYPLLTAYFIALQIIPVSDFQINQKIGYVCVTKLHLFFIIILNFNFNTMNTKIRNTTLEVPICFYIITLGEWLYFKQMYFYLHNT